MQVPRGPESGYIGVSVSPCPVSHSTLKGPLHAFYHQAKQRVQCDGYVCEEIGRIWKHLHKLFIPLRSINEKIHKTSKIIDVHDLAERKNRDNKVRGALESVLVVGRILHIPRHGCTQFVHGSLQSDRVI